MRELKFRAWDDLNKKWLMGYDHPNLGGFSLTGELVLLGEWANCFDQFLFNKNGKQPEHLIIEQYTGLKDKNEKEIYDGDMVKAESFNPPIYQVEFIEGAFCATHEKLKHYPLDMNHFYDSTGCAIEVVGNIHEGVNKQ